MTEPTKTSAPIDAVVIRQVWIVRMDVRYDYDQECSGVIRCFETEELGQAFRDDLQEHWEEFRETWHSDDNRWGGRFYLSMSPQGFEGVEVEEWPIYSAV